MVTRNGIDVTEEVLTPYQIRVEALNIASREAVARSYDGLETVKIAEKLLRFIEEG